MVNYRLLGIDALRLGASEWRPRATGSDAVFSALALILAKSVLAAIGVVVGFLILATPAHAETGGPLSTLGKSLQDTSHMASGLSQSTGHLVKQARHTIVKTSHPRPATHARTAGRQVHKASTTTRHTASRAVSVAKITRSVAHRAMASSQAFSRVPTGRVAAGATKITEWTTKITSTAAKTASGRKITATASKIATGGQAVATGTITTTTATTLTKLVQPVSGSVLGTTTQLRERTGALLVRSVAAVPPILGAISHRVTIGAETGTAALPPAAAASQTPPLSLSLAGSGSLGLATGTPITDSTRSVAGSTAGSPSTNWIAALVDVVRSLSAAFLETGASYGGTAVAVALITMTVGVVAGGSAGSSGSASLSFALLDSVLVPAGAGGSRRFAGALRQIGWRMPGRPSFSPD